MSENTEETTTPTKMNSVLFPNEHKYLTFLKKVFRHEFRKN